MPIQTQPLGDKRAEAIRKMFASVARRYDLVNTLLSVGTDGRWRRRGAASVRLPAEALILDLCTGTGKLAAELRRRFPGSRVIGADFCLEMLSLAHKSVPSLPFVCADALCLPLKGGSFDLVAVGFGIRNFADLKSGLCEVRRILKPTGAVLLLEFSAPRPGLAASFYGLYLGRIVPFLGEKVSGVKGAYSYLRDSVNSFPTAERLAGIMEEVGFEDVTYRPLSGGIVAIHVGWRGD